MQMIIKNLNHIQPKLSGLKKVMDVFLKNIFTDKSALLNTLREKMNEPAF